MECKIWKFHSQVANPLFLGLIKELGFKHVLLQLRKSILKLTFSRWPKTEDNRKVLMESYDIRLLRIEYFKQILKHRDEGRPTFYTDESYVHTTHLPNHSWTDRSGKCVMKSVAS
jgi:hypothetical protein